MFAIVSRPRLTVCVYLCLLWFQLPSTSLNLPPLQSTFLYLASTSPLHSTFLYLASTSCLVWSTILFLPPTIPSSNSSKLRVPLHPSLSTTLYLSNCLYPLYLLPHLCSPISTPFPSTFFYLLYSCLSSLPLFSLPILYLSQPACLNFPLPHVSPLLHSSLNLCFCSCFLVHCNAPHKPFLLSNLDSVY